MRETACCPRRKRLAAGCIAESVSRLTTLTGLRLSAEQLAYHRGVELLDDVRVGEEAVGELGFFDLEAVDAFLDGVLAEELVDEDGLVLADAVGAVGGLRLGGGLSPGVVVDHGVGGGEVEAGAADSRGVMGGVIFPG